MHKFAEGTTTYLLQCRIKLFCMMSELFPSRTHLFLFTVLFLLFMLPTLSPAFLLPLLWLHFSQAHVYSGPTFQIFHYENFAHATLPAADSARQKNIDWKFIPVTHPLQFIFYSLTNSLRVRTNFHVCCPLCIYSFATATASQRVQASLINTFDISHLEIPNSFHHFSASNVSSRNCIFELIKLPLLRFFFPLYCCTVGPFMGGKTIFSSFAKHAWKTDPFCTTQVTVKATKTLRRILQIFHGSSKYSAKRGVMPLEANVFSTGV